MPIHTEQDSDTYSIRLDGVVDIAAGTELKAALLDGLERGGELRLSLADVTCLDVTAVQLLWAAERESRAAGVHLQLDGGLPEPVAAMLTGVGFESFPLS